MADTNSSGGGAWLRDRWHSGDLAPVVSLLVLIVIFTVLVGPRDFLSLGTVSLVLKQGAVLAIVSAGMTFVLLAAEIDLAVGKDRSPPSVKGESHADDVVRTMFHKLKHACATNTDQKLRLVSYWYPNKIASGSKATPSSGP